MTCFRYAFLFDYSKYVWLAVGVIAVVLLGYSVTMSDRRGKMDATRRAENGNFDYSHKETYGSAKQMTTGEIKKFFKVLPATVEGMSKTNGDVVFGFLNEKKKKIVSMPDRDWSKGTDYNRNIAVCGPPGTGKTRAFVMNYIISKLSAGESLYVVDTKGEIYAKTCSFAKAQGYEVKILNLIETDCSDGWDVLGEVENDPEMAMELAATVIRNTGGAKTDPFWNDAEMNILKAVILLKSVGEADISNRTG
ncbi:MAG: type IV secretory system conjugative DNA transfer family protein, partial [Ruminococcus sp.]|nr:type IV secretory system conjugative DNA transfer family protein [Ruminococcus sp.]